MTVTTLAATSSDMSMSHLLSKKSFLCVLLYIVNDDVFRLAKSCLQVGKNCHKRQVIDLISKQPATKATHPPRESQTYS